MEVPIRQMDIEYYYMVQTNDHTSNWYSFQGMPSERPLKIVIMADWGFAGDVYAYPYAMFTKSVASYTLLTCSKNQLKLSLKTLQGEIIYKTTLANE